MIRLQNDLSCWKLSGLDTVNNNLKRKGPKHTTFLANMHVASKLQTIAQITRFCFTLLVAGAWYVMVRFIVSYDSANKQKHHKSHRMQ